MGKDNNKDNEKKAKKNNKENRNKDDNIIVNVSAKCNNNDYVVYVDKNIYIASFDYQNYIGTAVPTEKSLDKYHKMLGSKNISFEFGFLDDYYENYDEDDIITLCDNITSSFDHTICDKYDLIFDCAAINVGCTRLQVHIYVHTDTAVTDKQIRGISRDFYHGDYKRYLRDVYGIDTVY